MIRTGLCFYINWRGFRISKVLRHNHSVQHGDSAQIYTENCVSTVYEGIIRKKAAKCLILLEAGTGIEPVYTDLQSAA